MCCLLASQVFFALTFCAISISQSSSVASDSYKARTAAASIFAIIERKSEIDPNEESGVTLPNVNGDIQLHHVSFTYPTRPDVQILRDLSLTIRSGKARYSYLQDFGCVEIQIFISMLLSMLFCRRLL